MQLKKDSFSESWIPGFCIFHQFWSPLYQRKTAKFWSLRLPSPVRQLLGTHCGRCRVAEISRLFVRATAHSLFALEFSFGHQEQSSSQLDVQKAGQMHNAILFFQGFRGSGYGGSWMYARGTEGGVVKPSEATFALTFATPCAVSPTQLVLPEGREGATRHGHTHSTYGIEHAWNPSRMKPQQRESASLGVQLTPPTMATHTSQSSIWAVEWQHCKLGNSVLKMGCWAGIPKLQLWK